MTIAKHFSLLLLLLAGSQFSDCTSRNSSSVGTPEQHYKEFCSGCHGEKARGFVNYNWKHGQQPEDLFKAIKTGYPDGGMPAYDTTFTDREIQALVDYILMGIKNADGSNTTENLPAHFETANFKISLDTVYAEKNAIPWGLEFLPSGDLLVSDRGGTLFRLDAKGNKIVISGTPEVLAQGQGGLMDVQLHPDYRNNQVIYLSYSAFKKEGGQTVSTTAVTRARLMNDRLVEQEMIFEALPYATTSHHYGSRLEFDREGFLYVSVGDRGNRDENPQSLDNHCGKIHRLHDDGKIPADNPFVDRQGAMASIWSYGHRNPQGMGLRPADGKIWSHEHGPKGGDEVNVIEKGANYGWPVVSYGVNYNGTSFTDKTEAPGMNQPELYWVPSIAPCGMAFVEGDKYPGWKGDLLVGSLRFDQINRCRIQNGKIQEEIIELENIGRVRNVRMGPDGFIYVAVEQPGFIFRLVPLQ